MKTIDEQKHLKALARGDASAFSALFLQYFPKVKRYISNLLQNESEAEDLSQDIFARLWNNRSQTDEIENLNAYLHHTARNAVYQYIRRIILFREYSEKQSQAAIIDQNLIEMDVEATYHAQELELLILATVDKMPPQRKRIYEMSRREGKNNEEIANILSISKRTVENHLTLALAEIRKVIKNVFVFI